MKTFEGGRQKIYGGWDGEKIKIDFFPRPPLVLSKFFVDPAYFDPVLSV